jgi:general secretion pathway protein H
MRQDKFNNAFTLIELMVVLAIIGLLMAVVAPRLPGVLDSTRVKSAVREITANLKASRSNAVTSSTDEVLIFNVENKTYGNDENNKTLDLPDDVKMSLITAETEQLSDDEGGIRFYKDGSSTGGQVKLEYKNNEYVVDVNWLTGKVNNYR